MSRTSWLFIVGLAIAMVGCGAADSASPDGGSPGKTEIPQCSQDIPACGGSPVGSWKVVGFCGVGLRKLAIADTPHCNEIETTNRSYDGTGNYEYRADGTVQGNIEFKADLELKMVAACLADLVTGQHSLSEICSALEPELAPESGEAVVSCKPTAEQGCDCTITSTFSDTWDDTWKIENGELIDRGEHVRSCVQGDVFQRQGYGDDPTTTWTTVVMVRSDT